MITSPPPDALPVAPVLESDGVVQRELAHKLALRELFSTRTSFVGYGFQAILLRDLVDSGLLLAWVASVLLLELVNAWVAKRLLLSLDEVAARERNIRYLSVTLFLASCAWGMAAVLPGVTSSTPTTSLNLLLLAVVVIISVHNLCYRRSCQSAFAFGIGAPVMVHGLCAPFEPAGMLGLGAFLLVLMVYLYGNTAHRLVVQDICSRVLSERMAAELQRINAELTQAMERIRVLASHDPLTHCLNRRALLESLAHEKARRERYGDSFGVMLLDIDHFKLINDTYGHSVGDTVLVVLADHLRAHLRPTDSLARWGGEEFLCLVGHVDADSLQAKAETLRSMLAKSPWPQVPQVLSVTASIGVAIYRPGQSIEQVIELADQALYRAKLGGRNRVCA